MPAVELVAFGDLYLAEVRAYRERLLVGTGFAPLFPLWGRETTRLAADFVAAGFRAVLVCVDTTQLAFAFAGRAFDLRLLTELPASVDPCGEGGEFHTFVWDGPHFREPIQIRVGETILRDGRFAYTELVPSGMGAEHAANAV